MGHRNRRSVITVLRPDLLNDGKIITCISMAPQFLYGKNGKSLLQFSVGLRLFLPDAMLGLGIGRPTDEIWSYCMRRTAAEAFAVHNVEITPCRLWMRPEPRCRSHDVRLCSG
jgi:hypothetical protein